MIHQLSTRELLVESLKELSLTKSIESITITEIAENCGLTRRSFYNSFSDKYEAVNYVFIQDVQTVLKKGTLHLLWKDVLTEMLNEMYKKKPFYTNAIRIEGQNSLKSFIQKYTEEAYASFFLSLSNESLSEELKFSISFNALGAAGTIANWIKEGMKTKPRKLAELIEKNMPEQMKEFMESQHL